jgi:uncharacterized protein YjbI with pentapeptide repeats
MGEVPAEFCGYEWPKDCERFDYDDREGLDKGDSLAQTTCVRETLPDTGQCAWHAAPDETEHKSIETLQDTRVPAEIRAGSKLAESLDGATLAGMKIDRKIRFSGVLLRYANFSNTRLSEVDFSDSYPQRADFSDSIFSNTNFSGADLRGADFSDAEFSDVDLPGAKLEDVCFSDADFFYSDLSGSDIFDADLSETFFYNTKLSDVNLLSADFSGAHLRSTTFAGSNFRDAFLKDIIIDSSNFSNTTFDDANLSEASLEAVNLSGANIYDADLSHASLNRTNLSGASLRSATLTEANLTRVELSDLTVDRETTLTNLAEPECPSPWSLLRRGGASESDSDNGVNLYHWDQTARAYHDLKTESHDNGLIEKARRLHINERRARRHETAAEEGWFSRQHLIQLALGPVTGYGVGVWRLVGMMTALFIISTVTYALAGVVDPLTYSTITFATSPPRPTGSLPIWARFVANVETFVGTLLIVSLGFVLGNREQF